MPNSRESSLLSQVIRHCRKAPRSVSKIIDSTGASLSGPEALARALALRRILRRYYLAPDERYVGILMPPTAAGLVTNLALAFDKRISVNLNYVLSPDTLQHCIDLTGIKHVITSRKVLERLDIAFNATAIILEDIPPLVRSSDKAVSAALGMFAPIPVLERSLGLGTISADDVLTVLFTAGSTGEPKGVMLTHGNLQANCEAIRERIGIRDDDVLAGILPFFHAFGLNITMWMVLSTHAKVIYHTNPLETDVIADLINDHRATILLSTPSFLRLYSERIDPNKFQSLNMVATGAERLRPALADRFEERFGIRPFEGYGVTEAAPAIAFNVPSDRWQGNGPAPIREGTVGQPVPGVAIKVVNRETGNLMKDNQEGVLHIKGANVMAGYLHRPDLTAKVVADGWYNTGDVVTVDSDGFVTITGRESQFSKIGGETVPHLLVEETLNSILEQLTGDDFHTAVTAVPHTRRGERVVVVHTPLPCEISELTSRLRQSRLPHLYIPSDDSFIEVEKLPLLGSGKVDLRGLRELAEQAFDTDGKRLPVGTHSLTES